MNINSTFLPFLLLSTLVFANEQAMQGDKLVLHFFGSPSCGECIEIKEVVLYPLLKEHEGKIDLRIYDVDSDSGFQMMTRMEDAFSVKGSASIELFLPDTFLIGPEEIHTSARRLISERLAHPVKQHLRP